jgi:putative FmdB family regulatory protein
MPIYEYQCGDCGIKFDALRAISQADDPIACEHCNGTNTMRKVSAAFAHSSGSNGSRIIAGGGNNSSCSGCSGGSCSTCGN